MTNVLILGANGQIARFAAELFLEIRHSLGVHKE